MPKESYKTFQTSVQEWIKERPTGNTSLADWDDSLAEFGDERDHPVDDGDPERHRKERLTDKDPLTPNIREVVRKANLRPETVYEQLDTLMGKFSDIDDQENLIGMSETRDMIRSLTKDVAVNKGQVPTEKALATLLGAALHVNTKLPLKLICSRLGVSRRSIIGWADDMATLFRKTYNLSDQEEWVVAEGYEYLPEFLSDSD